METACFLESRAGVRDDTRHATEVERATGQLVLPNFEAEADAHLTRSGSSHQETVAVSILTWKWILISVIKKSTQMHSWRTKLRKKKPTDANTQIIGRINIGSTKNPATPYAKWAMWMELIELKKSSIQCRSCLQKT